MEVIAYQHSKTQNTPLCERLADMQASSKSQSTYPSGAMCVVAKLYQQAEDSRSFDLDAFPHSEELDLHMSDDATSVVLVALQCLGGETGDFLSYASSSLRFKSELHPASEAWLIMPLPVDCSFAIICLGQDKGLFLAHWDRQVYLTPNSCELSPL